MVPGKSKKAVHHSLREIQSFIWTSISRPLTAEYEMRKRWIDGRDLARVSSEYVLANRALTSFRRLEIYNQQYWYRILDCFEDDFPGLKAVLGDRRFYKLARAYLERHPSDSFSLRDLGSHIVSFVQQNLELIEPHADLCVELAQFEWAQVVAFDGPSCPVVSEKEIRSTPPDKLRLRLQPYITLLQIDHALDQYSVSLSNHERERSEAGSGKRSPKTSNTAPWPVKEKVDLVVHRHENMVYFKRLDAGAFQLLSALERGRTLAEAIEDLVSHIEEHGLTSDDLHTAIEKWFNLWIRLGWLCPVQ